MGEYKQRQTALQRTRETFERDQKNLEAELKQELKNTENVSQHLADLAGCKVELQSRQLQIEHLKAQIKVALVDFVQNDAWEVSQAQHAKTLEQLQISNQKVSRAERECENLRNQMKAQETVKLHALELLCEKEDQIVELRKKIRQSKSQQQEVRLDTSLQEQWEKILHTSDQRILWTENKLTEHIKTNKCLFFFLSFFGLTNFFSF